MNSANSAGRKRKLLFFSAASVLALLLFLPAGSVLAHVEAEDSKDEQIEATIVEPDLFTAGAPITVWLEVKDKASGALLENLGINVEVHALSGQEEKGIFTGKAAPKGSEGGKVFYLTEVTFPGSGAHELHYEFTYQGEEKVFTFPIFVAHPAKESLWLLTVPVKAGAVLVALAFAALMIWGKMTKKYKKMVILLVVLVAASVVAYSLYFTVKSGALQSGVVTCLADGQCFWTAHVHSYLVIKACGQEKTLPAEVGPLKAAHTHEERNLFHWHDRLPYDNLKKEILDTKPLSLDSSFNDISVPLEREKFFDLKNGDNCPDGTEGTWKMFVNGKRSDRFGEYIWRDRDVIIFIFDSRAEEEIEEDLRQNPVSFPALGRG